MTDSTKVRVAQWGEIFVAPLGTTLPTDATTDPGVLFVSVGGISEEGVVWTPTRDVGDVKDWAGDSVRDMQTGVACEFAFSMLETNDTTKSLLDLTQGTGWTGSALPLQAWVIDWHDEDDVTRYCIPSSRITAQDAVSLKASEAVKFGVKLSPKKVSGKYFMPYYGTEAVS